MINLIRALSKRIKEYKTYKETFNKQVAKYRVLANIFCKEKFPDSIRWYFQNKRTESIENFICDRYKNIINKYKDAKTLEGQYSKKIWICWWQGEEQAPIIVKKCINSIKKNKGDYELILITKDNYKEYIDIPDEIIEKVNKKIITLTHFSDLIRMNLLTRYGGIWVDATIFATKDISTLFENRKFNTVKKLNIGRNINVSKGRWCGYFIGGASNNFFKFMNEMLIQYNMDYNYLIDYFLIDYLIDIAYKNFEYTKEMIDNSDIEGNNISKLINSFNEDYTEDKYNNILKSSAIFKLSYKRKFKEDATKTIYQYFIS